MNRPSLCTRTFPLPKRSATVATVSLVFLVHELTATIRSPRESFLGRGLRIRECFFIESTPLLTAIPAPAFNVNNPPVAGRQLLASYYPSDCPYSDNYVSFVNTWDLA